MVAMSASFRHTSLEELADLALMHDARQKLVDQLEQQLPDELVVQILEHLMLEPRQPVRIQATPVSQATPRVRTVIDPSLEKCHLMFHGCNVSPRLLARAREAYFKANTIRIDAPE